MTVFCTVGTSIEAGVGHPTGQSWPAVLSDCLPLKYLWQDRSLGGGAYTANDANGDNIRKHVDAAIKEFEPGVMFFGGPVNDLVRAADTGPLRWAVHCADEVATAAGWRVVGGAILPFSDGGAFQAGWWPNLEGRRSEYNSWGAAHFGTRWVDLSAWLKETTTARGDARWFRDGLHLNRLGAVVVGNAFPLGVLGAP